MTRALVVCGESRGFQNVFLALSNAGWSPLMAADLPAAHSLLAEEAPELTLVDLGIRPPRDPAIGQLVAACKGMSPVVPVMGLIPSPDPELYDHPTAIDDFVLPPYRAPEVVLRMNHLLRRFKPTVDDALIHTGPLLIDHARYEATLDRRRLDLTFKEYELLRFLASSPGKVFTREALLNQVWGYDYFGGTRTVDVHIRRLRSKIETTSTFIETVRNVGYRFSER